MPHRDLFERTTLALDIELVIFSSYEVEERTPYR